MTVDRKSCTWCGVWDAQVVTQRVFTAFDVTADVLLFDKVTEQYFCDTECRDAYFYGP